MFHANRSAQHHPRRSPHPSADPETFCVGLPAENVGHCVVHHLELMQKQFHETLRLFERFIELGLDE
jgi:hypothetical protein